MISSYVLYYSPGVREHFPSPSSDGEPPPSLKLANSSVGIHTNPSPPVQNSEPINDDFSSQNNDTHPLLSETDSAKSEIRKSKVLKNFFKEHHKKCCCCSITLLLIILLVSVAFFIPGAHLYKHDLDLIEMNALNQTSYSVGDEIIILGKVNADVVSTVTVEEKPQHSDSSHVSMVYLPAESELNKHVENIDNAYERFYSPNPWRTTGEIESTGTYILDTGLINYMFCSTNPGQSTGEANAYIFDDYKSYFEYAGQSPGSQASSYIFHKAMEVGTFNQTMCQSFEFPIDKPAYYFVAIDTPSSLYYKYSYHIRDVYLNRTDYSIECEKVSEDEDHPCVIDLSSKTGLYYVLAYVRPHVDLESVTTHLHVFTNRLSCTDYAQCTLGIGLMSVGGFILFFDIIVCCVCVYLCVKCLSKK